MATNPNPNHKEVEDQREIIVQTILRIIKNNLFQQAIFQDLQEQLQEKVHLIKMDN